ncbi:MAG: hypothetical protein M1838_004289 [Thelocarpon superellum]|nr:MAG: hypothetical protein M1838_004289 [Thelocarpon superellum]
MDPADACLPASPVLLPTTLVGPNTSGTRLDALEVSAGRHHFIMTPSSEDQKGGHSPVAKESFPSSSTSEEAVSREKRVTGATSPGPDGVMLDEDEDAAVGNHVGWRRIVRNFTPSWFSVTMGTGVVSILLFQLPYNGVWLYYLSIVFFGLNILLFTLFAIISVLRYTLFRDIWGIMMRHPTQSLFLGTVPMGFATIVNMFVFVCVPAWGDWAITLAWTLWWADVVVAVSVCFFLPFVIMYVHETKLSAMTAAWLLPIVATIVASASGGIVADALQTPEYALWTMLTSYVLWGTGVPLAMATLVIYFQRLTVYKLPPREVIVSVFLPLGPLGQGGFAVMQLGKVALRILPATHTLTPASGEILYTLGFIVALIMWGFALVWLFFAVASISQSRFPFNMGWWGFTFPVGVFAVATTTFGRELDSRFFDVLGTVLSIAVVLLWIGIAIGTIARSLTGAMFVAPCLADLEMPAKTKTRRSSQAATNRQGSAGESTV